VYFPLVVIAGEIKELLRDRLEMDLLSWGED
jgi:hypothetical protein